MAHIDCILNVSYHRICSHKDLVQNMIKDKRIKYISFEVILIALRLKCCVSFLLLDIGYILLNNESLRFA